jgi:predicted MarR family transcription regulator
VLLAEDKETAKYSSDFCMDSNLDGVLHGLRQYLDRKDLTILSALERNDRGQTVCEIYGIVAGEDVEEVQHIEHKLQKLGLYHTG